MRRKFLLFLICLVALPALAEVSVLSVKEENKNTKKEDFYHTFEYYVSAGNKHSKCQATRITSQWFITAAHCVELCAKECTLQVDLLEQPVSALVEAKHSAKKPIIFVHPAYNPKKKVTADLALFRLDLNRASKTYYMRTADQNAPNIEISEKQFAQWLDKHRRAKSQYLHALSPQMPPLVVFDDRNNYELDRKISVISIFGGRRNIKANPNPVYCVKKEGYCYTKNFGVRRGMSGSGVITNTGELLGIVSAYVGLDWFKGEEKKAHQEFFLFPIFNDNILAFIQEVMGNDFAKISQQDAYPYLVKKLRADFVPVQVFPKK
ncbi:MAG: trypsin-like serine protease [Elusimicrobiaceae bacterium]|nr:trypsin-like serine protease [Elusimicrobiaceae bacterium]